MSASNTIRGKAFEYATLIAFRDALKRDGVAVWVEEHDAYMTAKRAFDVLDDGARRDYMAAADTAVDIIRPLEPRLSVPSAGGSLTLRIQTDAQGQAGDVRDIVFIRSSEGWEIGISCKHNHEALKHPRVRRDADFGSDWIGVPCSREFLGRIRSVMDILEDRVGKPWCSFGDTHEVIYKPVIEAYIDEIRRMCGSSEGAPAKLVGYFFGVQDFYKVIAKDRRGVGRAGLTKVMAFNLNGSLGRDAKGKKALHAIRRTSLPSRLVEIRPKAGTSTTLEMIFDGGWTISMRLHSADSRIKLTGLKWDIQLIGMPTGLYEQERPWDGV